MSHLSIEKVAIVGGTHGNELIGAFQVRKFEQFPQLIQRSNFETLTLLANSKAIEAGRRYIDTDLNRCFNTQDLQNPKLVNYEQLLAKKIALTIQQEKIDLIIDLHTTTSNMGLTVILPNNHPYLLRLAAYLTAINPLVKVLGYPPSQEPILFG
jgi:aspartoacylase